MSKFKLESVYKPIDDQKRAIESLSQGIEKGVENQVLLGVTGSGKTFTVANVIEKVQKPTLIISHNKTLAAQLYQEMKDFFPENAVSYFVSYYDYYQPEAYIPSTDTYIEKDAGINELIDKLRLAATTNLMTRKDTIVVSSVSCIYNIGSPFDYSNFAVTLNKKDTFSRESIIKNLIDLQYERADFGFKRATFRVRGNILDIYPSYEDIAYRLETGFDKIENITKIQPVSGDVLDKSVEELVLYPAKHFVTEKASDKAIFAQIRDDLDKRVKELKGMNKELEAHRLSQRVNYDLEMIEEVGYVKGIENYSRYFDGRAPGEAPYSLLEYFNKPYGDDWLVVVDESHITFPQIRGMYAGDKARKETLIDYGFRLPASIDNRPLKFEEFVNRIPGFLAVSATPSEWELTHAKESAAAKYGIDKADRGIVEQLIRPTFIPDPKVDIRPIKNQVADVIEEIKKRAEKKQRTLVTTLTKKTAEDLAAYLDEKGLKVHYLHSDVKTLDRTDILDDLRRGNYDCLVGINLLREGLDLPEVSLVAILDADKEGFLRSDVTLIQTMGRAARHVEGEVIMYADNVTGSMQRALDEVERRREIQIAYNKKHGITPKSISKPIREKLIDRSESDELRPWEKGFTETTFETLDYIDTDSMTPMEIKKLVKNLKKEMRVAAESLHFELAAEIRDKIKEIDN